jgi:hypothetical protein
MISKKELVQELKKYGVFVPEDKIGDQHYLMAERFRSKTVESEIKPEYAEKVNDGECPICFYNLEECLVCINCGAEFIEDKGHIKYREGTCQLEGGRFTILSNLRTQIETGQG